MVRSRYSYHLTPSDSCNISSVILTNSQYILWDLEQQKHLHRSGESSARSPKAQLTISQLARDPPNHKAEDQAKTPSRAGIRDIKNAARRTLLTVQLQKPMKTPIL